MKVSEALIKRHGGSGILNIPDELKNKLEEGYDTIWGYIKAFRNLAESIHKNPYNRTKLVYEISQKINLNLASGITKNDNLLIKSSNPVFIAHYEHPYYKDVGTQILQIFVYYNEESNDMGYSQVDYQKAIVNIFLNAVGVTNQYYMVGTITHELSHGVDPKQDMWSINPKIYTKPTEDFEKYLKSPIEFDARITELVSGKKNSIMKFYKDSVTSLDHGISIIKQDLTNLQNNPEIFAYDLGVSDITYTNTIKSYLEDPRLKKQVYQKFYRMYDELLTAFTQKRELLLPEIKI